MCPFTAVEHLVDAMIPPEDVAPLLEIGPEEPCLRLVRTTRLGQQTVTHVELIHPGHALRLGGRFAGAALGGGPL